MPSQDAHGRLSRDIAGIYLTPCACAPRRREAAALKRASAEQKICRLHDGRGQVIDAILAGTFFDPRCAMLVEAARRRRRGCRALPPRRSQLHHQTTTTVTQDDTAHLRRQGASSAVPARNAARALSHITDIDMTSCRLHCATVANTKDCATPCLDFRLRKKKRLAVENATILRELNERKSRHAARIRSSFLSSHPQITLCAKILAHIFRTRFYHTDVFFYARQEKRAVPNVLPCCGFFLAVH